MLRTKGLLACPQRLSVAMAGGAKRSRLTYEYHPTSPAAQNNNLFKGFRFAFHPPAKIYPVQV